MPRLKMNVVMEIISRRAMVTIPSLKRNGGGYEAAARVKNMYAIADIMNAVLQCDVMEVSGPAGNKLLKIVAHQGAKAFVITRLIQTQPKLKFEMDNMPLEGLQAARYMELLSVTMTKVADGAMSGLGVATWDWRTLMSSFMT